MSEVLAVHDEAGTQGENAQTSMTAGTLLRQAREAAGLSLAGLAAELGSAASAWFTSSRATSMRPAWK